MARTEDVEKVIRVLWEEGLISDISLETLLRKLRFFCRSIYTELDDEKIKGYFDAPSLEEMIMRAAIEDKAYEFSEKDLRRWLENFLTNKEWTGV